MIPALGVNEPYASAIVHGLKRWETRGQPPNGEMRPVETCRGEQFREEYVRGAADRTRIRCATCDRVVRLTTDGQVPDHTKPVRSFPGVRLARGGRVMVVANAKRPGTADGWVRHSEEERHWLDPIAGQFELRRRLMLHPGHIVGSVTVTDALPIIPDTNDPPDKAICHCIDGRLELQEVTGDPWVASNVHHTDISDQLPWGDWRPGRWAWQLADPKTTNEMCPVCEGRGFVASIGGPAWNPSRSMLLKPTNSISWKHCFACDGMGQCDPIPVRGHQGLRPLTPEQFL